MVEAADHDTKTALAEFLYYFVPVTDVVVVADVVFLLIRVKAMVGRIVDFTPLAAARQTAFLALGLVTLCCVEVVNGWIVENLASFVLRHVISKNTTCFLGSHWELILSCRH